MPVDTMTASIHVVAGICRLKSPIEWKAMHIEQRRAPSVKENEPSGLILLFDALRFLFSLRIATVNMVIMIEKGSRNSIIPIAPSSSNSWIQSL